MPGKWADFARYRRSISSRRTSFTRRVGPIRTPCSDDKCVSACHAPGQFLSERKPSSEEVCQNPCCSNLDYPLLSRAVQMMRGAIHGPYLDFYLGRPGRRAFENAKWAECAMFGSPLPRASICQSLMNLLAECGCSHQSQVRPSNGLLKEGSGDCSIRETDPL